MGKRASRNTVNYVLRDGRKIVYRGITNNPERRYKEHKKSGKRFTSMTTSVKLSREKARKREKKRIKRYSKNHGGKTPRYNKRI